MRTLSRFSLAAILAVAFITTTVAAPTDEALSWIQKMGSLYEKPYTMDYEIEFAMAQMGQMMDFDAGGTITQNGRKLMNMKMEMKIKMAGETQPGMPTEMEMSMYAVSDGEMMWTEMQMPMMPGKQVMKMKLDQVEQLAGKSGVPMGGQGLDPLSQIEQATEILDFAVVGSNDETVTLAAKLTPEAIKKFASGAPPEMFGNPEGLNYEIDVDKKTGRPVAIRMGGDKPVMQIRFKNFTILSEDELPEGVFTYTPPEGASVIDLGAMLGAQGN